MTNSKLLKEAIADAKVVRETAIANAKIALEEAFAPRLNSIISKQIQEELDDYSDGDNAPSSHSSKLGGGGSPSTYSNSSSELASTNDDTEEEDSDLGFEDDNYDFISEDDIPGEDQSRLSELDDFDLDEEFNFDDLEESDELEFDLDEDNEFELDEEFGDDELEFDLDEDIEFELDEEFGDDELEFDLDEDMEDDSFDLDEILRELDGDDYDTFETYESSHETELEEAYKVIKTLKKTINEVNLLNAKLLYTNKLFRSYNMTNEQKHKVVETLDKTHTLREVKLVFNTLTESLKMTSGVDKKSTRKITESFASAPIRQSNPNREILTESDSLAERFKELANIKSKK